MESTNPICKQINELLDAFHDGELRGEEQTLVERHLKECESCVAKIADIDRVVAEVKKLAPVQVPVGMSDRLDNLIDQQTKVVPMRRRAAWAAGAVAAVAVIAVGIGVAGGGGSSAPTIATKTGTPAAPVTTHPNATQQETPTQIAALPTTTSVAPTVTVAPKGTASTTAIAQHDLATVTHGANDPVTTASAKPSVPAVKPTKSPSTADGGMQIASAPSNNATLISSHYDAAGTTSAMDVGSSAASEEIADLPVTTDSFNEAIGLSTDEDGLYDIKM